MTRHQMRESAFMLVFERIFNQEDPDEIVAMAQECEVIELNVQAIELFKGVEEKKATLDSHIEKHLKNWSIARISKVSLAVLRIAMYEILFCDDIDIDIAISEGIKIAQVYTLKEDVSFINGVLSSVSKEMKNN